MMISKVWNQICYKLDFFACVVLFEHGLLTTFELMKHNYYALYLWHHTNATFGGKLISTLMVQKKFLQIFVLGPPWRDALKIGKLVGQKLFYSNFMPHFILYLSKIRGNVCNNIQILLQHIFLQNNFASFKSFVEIFSNKI